MKMVKSLLLGTAAGFVAVAGAQAADMPVKAQPVQYVKICTLYGDGFYYIPGTDICLKLGGYIRAEYGWGTPNGAASLTQGPWQAPNGNGTRTDGQDWTMRSRAYIWMDSRQQTEYGTLRAYFQLGVNYDSPQATTTSFSANRAFIQFAGFTVGTAQSFYDFYSVPATSYIPMFGASDTGDPGWKVIAYTAQFGNGVSGTVSLEEARNFGSTTPIGGIANTNLGNFALGTASIDSDRAKERFPDIVSNWRVDQAWGSAQVMFAAHDASGGYYGTTLTGSEVFGHPADKLGWAAGAGIKLNTFGGDYFQFQANYTQGAIRYAIATQGGAMNPYQFQGNQLGYGFFTDGVYSVATGDVQLTTAVGINAAYDHFWRPDLRTSLYGAYLSVRYNDVANAALCSAQTTTGSGLLNFAAAGATGVGSCNNNFNWWVIGSRTQWNITPWFYVGFDVAYMKLQTASAGAVALVGATGAKPTQLYSIQDQDSWQFRVRFHRDIVP